MREFNINLLKLAKNLSFKYSDTRNLQSDLENIALEALDEAIRRYDPNKGAKISTWARRIIDQRLFRYMDRKQSHDEIFIPVESHPDVDADSNHCDIQRHIFNKDVLTLTKKELPSISYKVIAMRFGLEGQKEHTLEEVSNILNTSRESVRRIQNKAIRRLKNSFDSVDFDTSLPSFHFAKFPFKLSVPEFNADRKSAVYRKPFMGYFTIIDGQDAIVNVFPNG